MQDLNELNQQINDLNLGNEEKIRKLNDNNCILLCFGLPKLSIISIDLYSYTIDINFQGIKLIPKGIHFISIQIPNSSNDLSIKKGFLVNFKLSKRIYIYEYNKKLEILELMNDKEQIKRLTLAVNRYEFDQKCAVYPLHIYNQWYKLINYIKNDNKLTYTIIPTIKEFIKKQSLLPQDITKLSFDYTLIYNSIVNNKTKKKKRIFYMNYNIVLYIF